MILPDNLMEARFVSRPNRFVAIVEYDGREVPVHVANSGRLRELLTPDNVMLISPAMNPGERKTKFNLVLVNIDGVMVSADARLPNALVAEAIEAGRLPEFQGYSKISREITVGSSRLDLLLSGSTGVCYVETKSVTLVENSVAKFPDAPTERGRKHVRELLSLVEHGHRAAVVFVIQRSDVQTFVVDRISDPALFETVELAAAGGVEVYAYRCDVGRTSISILDRVPVVAP